MFDDSKIYKSIQQWQEPTTVWDGQPVLGFMAETFLDDLQVIGFIKTRTPMGNGTFRDIPCAQRSFFCRARSAFLGMLFS